MTGRGVSVAFDIGGTFADIVVLNADGTLHVDKVLSVTEVMVAAVRQAIAEALARDPGAELSALLHGTTVATNALLEGRGPRVGLLTTAGFRDELEIRREGRPAIYDFGWRRPAPLVPRRLRLEAEQRTAANGSTVVDLRDEDVVAAAESFGAQGVESVAVSFVNSFANPEHERRAAATLSSRLPGVAICLSSDVLPQPREYERTSTTVVNAFLVPVVDQYLGVVEEAFEQHREVLRVMQSNGGMASAPDARQSPVRIVESGPAAGVLAAAALCRELGIDRAVAFDMGGTTVKACLVERGDPVERAEYEIGPESHQSDRYSHGAGYVIGVPSFDIVEAGAGGGTIARWEDGVVRVGPVSAGASPGPAAYGRGGTLPTVTDANVVLGFISPKAIAGGTVGIDGEAAGAAIDQQFGSASALSTRDLAYGIFQVANASMMRRIRAVTTERGHDPRSCTLIAFGGSGPVHAAALAETIGISTIVIPPLAGVFSALGLLMADMRYDRSSGASGRLADHEVIDAIRAARELLTEEVASSATIGGATGVEFTTFVDLRYARQSSVISVAVPQAADWAEVAAQLAAEFHEEHRRRFGYQRLDEDVYLAAVHVRGTGVARAASIADVGRRALALTTPPGDTARSVYFGPVLGVREVPVISRGQLLNGSRLGPLIVDESTTTVVVPPRWTVSALPDGSLVLRQSPDEVAEVENGD